MTLIILSYLELRIIIEHAEQVAIPHDHLTIHNVVVKLFNDTKINNLKMYVYLVVVETNMSVLLYNDTYIQAEVQQEVRIR